MADKPNRRVAVTHPRTAAARLSGRRGVRRDLHEQTPLGEVLLRSLRRTQLRLALLLAAAFGTLLALIPLVFQWIPGTRDATVAELPVGWLLLGVAIFPLICLVGWLYVRAAERNERAFTELVDRS